MALWSDVVRDRDIRVVRDGDIRLLARVLEGGAPVGVKKRIEMGSTGRGWKPTWVVVNDKVIRLECQTRGGSLAGSVPVREFVLAVGATPADTVG